MQIKLSQERFVLGLRESESCWNSEQLAYLLIKNHKRIIEKRNARSRSRKKFQILSIITGVSVSIHSLEF